MSPESDSLKFFFQSEKLKRLNREEVDTCEGLLSVEECAKALSKFKNNKTPGSNGLTVEFCVVFFLV